MCAIIHVRVCLFVRYYSLIRCHYTRWFWPDYTVIKCAFDIRFSFFFNFSKQWRIPTKINENTQAHTNKKNELYESEQKKRIIAKRILFWSRVHSPPACSCKGQITYSYEHKVVFAKVDIQQHTECMQKKKRKQVVVVTSLMVMKVCTSSSKTGGLVCVD